MGTSLSTLNRSAVQLRADLSTASSADFWNPFSSEFDEKLKRLEGNSSSAPRSIPVVTSPTPASLGYRPMKRKESPGTGSTQATPAHKDSGSASHQLQNRKKSRIDGASDWQLSLSDLFNSLREYKVPSEQTPAPQTVKMGQEAFSSPVPQVKANSAARSVGSSQKSSFAASPAAVLSPFHQFSPASGNATATVKIQSQKPSRGARVLNKLLSVSVPVSQPQRKAPAKPIGGTAQSTPVRGSAAKQNQSTPNIKVSNILNLEQLDSQSALTSDHTDVDLIVSSAAPDAPPIAVLGSAAPPAPPLDVPAPPPPPPPFAFSSSAAPVSIGPKTKKLHWQPLAGVDLASTVFTELPVLLAQDSIFDLNELQSTFSVKQTKSFNPTRGSDSCSRPTASARSLGLIEERRSQNLEIAMTRFKMPIDDMLQALVEMRFERFTEDQIDILNKFAPSKDELKAVKKAAEDGKIDQFGPAEKFVHALSQVYRISERLSCMAFLSKFNENLHRLHGFLGVIEEGCKEIRASKTIRLVLFLVLKLGNMLNNTNNGGFCLSAINKLRFTKSADNSITLLHYLVSYLESEMPKVDPTIGQNPAKQLMNELKNVPRAAELQQSVIKCEIEQLAEGVAAVKQELAIHRRALTIAEKSSEESEYQAQIAAFIQNLAVQYEAASKEVQHLKQRMADCEKVSEELGRYFGESFDKWELLFGAFGEFLQSFQQVHREISIQKEKNAEKEKKIENEQNKMKAQKNALRESDLVNLDSLRTPAKAKSAELSGSTITKRASAMPMQRPAPMEELLNSFDPLDNKEN